MINNLKLYLYLFRSKDFNSKIYLLFYLIFTIYLISSLNWYDQSWQYDWEKHKIYFFKFFEKDHISQYIELAPWWHNVYGPWVYLVYFIVFLPFFYFADSLSGSVVYFQDIDHAIEYSIRMGNIILYGLYLYGLIIFSKIINLNYNNQKYFVLLSFFNPIVFQYSLYAIPENIIIASFPYLLIIFLQISKTINNGDFKNFITLKYFFSLLLIIIIATQKGNALILIIFLMLYLLLNINFNLKNIKTFMLVIIIIYLSINFTSYISKVFNGYWWWQHPIITHWANNPPPAKGFFTNFNLIDIWNNPFRGSQKNSMLGIWYIDLYGDYWNYWFNNKELVNKYNLNQVFIVKLGLVLSALTILVLFSSTCINIYYFYLKKINPTKFYFSLLWTLVFLISILMVNTGFDIRKGTSVNLMYSYFLISSLFFSIILSYEILKNIYFKSLLKYFFIFLLIGNFVISYTTPLKIYF